MKEYSPARKSAENRSIKWVANILLALPGWIALSGGIHSLQRMTQSFGNDINYMSLIDNWVPGIAVSFFVLGWFITHGIEIALLQRQIKLARALAICFLLAIFIVSWAWSSWIVHPVFHRLEDVFAPFLVSGYFFRYSVFSTEALMLLRSAFFGIK